MTQEPAGESVEPAEPAEPAESVESAVPVESVQPAVAVRPVDSVGAVDGTRTSAADDAPVIPAPALWPSVLIYSALRVLLVVVLAFLLSFLMIPLVALAFAVVLQLPLAWFLFAPQRRRVNAAMAAASRSRRAERDRLRSALSGEN